MKQIEAIIAWTPAAGRSCSPETAGQVAVLPAPDADGAAKRFMMRAGASSSALAALSEEARIARLFIDFQTLVVRDGIDPQAVHRAFLAIDEYRFRIAPDTGGRGVRGSAGGGLDRARRLRHDPRHARAETPDAYGRCPN